MSGFIERGGFWIAGQGVLMAGVVAGAWVWRDQWQSPVTIILAIGAFVLAAVFGLLGAVALGRNLTPFPKPGQRVTLVRHGIYGLVRHPLYTSVMLASLGWTLIWASGPALALTVVLGLFFNAKAAREERWLRERFPEYQDYARRVRRLIPWIY